MSKDLNYRLFVDSDGTGDKYTIVESSGGCPNISMDGVIEQLNAIHDKIQKASEQVEEFNTETLIEMKQQTTGVMEEFKEVEQLLNTVKKAVEVLDGKCDKELNPNVDEYKVEWECVAI